MSDLVPELFDAVELGAVGQQKVQGDALGLEQLDEGANLLGRVDMNPRAAHIVVAR